MKMAMGVAACCGVLLVVVFSQEQPAPVRLPAVWLTQQAAVTIPIAPVHVPEKRAAAVSINKVEAAVRDARARGADEGEVYRLRASSLTAQDIAMLGEREQAEKAWLERVDAWRKASADLDEAGRKRLRDDMFSEAEQAELATYETSAAPQLVLH
ncbi:MAG: hypothetical protein V4633_24590 [Pseudomonadota bacterium]